jgi:hypothetical protein
MFRRLTHTDGEEAFDAGLAHVAQNNVVFILLAEREKT